MDREQLVDRIGAKAPSNSEKPNVNKRAVRAAGANAPAPAPWLRSLSDYERRERHEYQVTRFG